MSARRGYTIVELLVVLLLLGVVSGAIYRLLNATQRVSRAQTERVEMESNMRMGALFLPAELREVGFDTSAVTGSVTPDIIQMNRDSIAFRTVRASGIICNVASGEVVVDTLFNYAQTKPPAVNFTLGLFAERQENTTADDSWENYPITNVSTGACSATYPYSPRNGIRIVAAGVPSLGSGVVTIGSPLHVYENVVYRGFSQGGEYWLGTRSLSLGQTTFQPVLGPLFSDSGFQLGFFDRTGVATTVPNDVRALQITLRALSSQRIDGSGGSVGARTVDSLVTVVQLRNAARP
jgi:prepilin-type N-terminal cleavage/methylation domain-containing protein